jgi:hypothetical protein
MKCEDCEYEPHCFQLLKITNTAYKGYCKQGRRKREYKTKPVALKEVLDETRGTDTTMEKVLPVQQ